MGRLMKNCSLKLKSDEFKIQQQIDKIGKYVFQKKARLETFAKQEEFYFSKQNFYPQVLSPKSKKLQFLNRSFNNAKQLKRGQTVGFREDSTS